jgi:hypothetical protein
LIEGKTKWPFMEEHLSARRETANIGSAGGGGAGLGFDER